jgi:hypothetical protein
VAEQTETPKKKPSGLLECPWCRETWHTDIPRQGWEHCPKCKGSFSFRKPYPVAAIMRDPEHAPTVDLSALRRELEVLKDECRYDADEAELDNCRAQTKGKPEDAAYMRGACNAYRDVETKIAGILSRLGLARATEGE